VVFRYLAVEQNWEEMMEKNDEKRLGNMLEEAKFATALVQNKSRQDLDQDKQLTLALLKALEMIAESSAKVSKECKLGCEPLPWDEIIEMKQQAVHTYWDIDRDWIWQRVTTDLPDWIKSLEELLQ
jgi:uncharacterized protein with HEPN domain